MIKKSTVLIEINAVNIFLFNVFNIIYKVNFQSNFIWMLNTNFKQKKKTLSEKGNHLVYVFIYVHCTREKTSNLGEEKIFTVGNNTC